MRTIKRKTFFPAEYERRFEVSSLLIPDHLLERFKRKSNFYGGGREYLHYLLLNVFTGELHFAPGINVRTQYQIKGQKLHKFNFRPFDEDWLHLKLLAQSMGISMAYLFVLMMLEDIARWGIKGKIFREHFGVPTNSRKISFSQTVIIDSLVHFSKKCRLRL